MIIEYINHPQLAGAAAVACSDLLGCWLLWLCRLILVMCLVIEIRVLVSLCKDKREYEQSRRKSNQRPSEVNKLPSQSLQLRAINLGKLRSQIQNLSVLPKNQRRDEHDGVFPQVLSNRSMKAIYLFSDFFGIKHKRKQPNGQAQPPPLSVTLKCNPDNRIS